MLRTEKPIETVSNDMTKTNIKNYASESNTDTSYTIQISRPAKRMYNALF